RLASMAQATLQVYELDYHDESHGFLFALGDQAWSFGPWSSDARVLYCCIENDKLVHLIVIGGTRVAWQEQPLLQTAATSGFFEWRKQDEVMNSVPGGFSLTALFEDMTGGSRSSSPDLSDRSSSQGSSPYAEKH